MALRHIVRALARPVTTTATTRSTGVALAARRGFFDKIEKGPEDPILGLSLAFNADTDPRKVNLGVGAYRDDENKPFVLSCVREAEKRIFEKKFNHEYLPIVGLAEFNKEAANLIFGADSPVIKRQLNATIQSLSGTGALRVAGDFLARFMPKTPIYLPNPTWANHQNIFRDSGIELKQYRYYDAKTCGLDFDGMLHDIDSAAPGILLLHACAHNPTGVDPTPSQWAEVSKVAKARGHFVLFDCAYQGFASGDCDRDALAVRKFVDDGHQLAVCQSFAKNFGLYSARTGALTFLGSDVAQKEKIESQLKILVRPMYSNPPTHGARVISTVLADPALRQLWLSEVKLMADRIISMRHKLVKGLKDAGSVRDWSHITNQIGMFTYTGLTPEQVDRLKDEFHIYMTRNGRASVAGMTSGNIEYLSKAMHAVAK